MRRPKDKIVYTYDLGEEWEHTITLVKVEPKQPTIDYPVCTGGRFNFPLEDGGGCNSDDEDYDADYFDKDEINVKIQELETAKEQRRQAGETENGAAAGVDGSDFSLTAEY